MAKGRRYRAMVEMQMGPAAGVALGLDEPTSAPADAAMEMGAN